MTLINRIIPLVVIIMSVGLTACSNKKKQPEVVKMPQYSDVIIMESKQNDDNIYSIKKGELSKVGDNGKTAELDYVNKSKVYTYINNISPGQNIMHNKINIISASGNNVIDSFFSASDLRISPGGTKIAFRSYKNDSLQSAEGMKVYSIANKKFINFNSKVLISGDLFKWIDDDEIIYYGISHDGNGKGEIYKYNFKENKEEQFLNAINGYCVFFMPVGGNIFYLEKENDESRLCYYDITSGKKNVLSSGIVDIWHSLSDYKGNSVYFIANGKNGSKNSVYKADLNNMKVQAITYDFPKIVDKDAGIALSSDGLLYFCGFAEENEQKKNDLYSFGINDNSITLISSKAHLGRYRIFYDKGIMQP